MQNKQSKKLIVLATSIIIGSSFFSTNTGLVQAEIQIEPVQISAEPAVGKAKTPQHFGKDKASAEKWAKEYFKKWKGTLNSKQKKLLGDSSRIKEMNHDIEKFRGSSSLLSFDSKEDMEIMDKALKEPSAKLDTDLHVYKKLKSTDLGYKGDSFYKSGTNTIDKEKFNQLKHDFQYGVINNFMEVDLTEHSADKSEPIQLHLKIPEGIGVGHLDKDQILLERDHGIEVKKTSIIVSKGKQIIKIEAEIVPKNKIEKKVKDMETSMNDRFQALTGLEHKFVNLEVDGFYNSSVLNRSQTLIKQLASNVPNNLAIDIIGKMSKSGALTLTDKDLINFDPDMTDDVMGFYHPQARSLYVKTNHKDHIDTTDNDIMTIIHEFGHAVDFLKEEGNMISKTPKFKQLYQEEKDNITIEEYIKTTPAEFFAGVFGYLHSPNVQQREQIMNEAPKTSKFIRDLVEESA